MAFIPCKLDWSKDDYYNYGDLNRVEHNTSYIAEIIGTFRSKPQLLSIIINRGNSTIEFKESLNRLESNIQILCDSFYIPQAFLGTKTNWRSGEYFDFNEANRIEDNIYKIYKLVESTIDAFKYCGAFSCGGVDI